MDPVVSFSRSDDIGGMSHSQSRVASLLGVGIWPAPVLAEEERKPLACRFQVLLIGVQAQQHIIVCNVFIKVPN